MENVAGRVFPGDMRRGMMPELKVLCLRGGWGTSLIHPDYRHNVCPVDYWSFTYFHKT